MSESSIPPRLRGFLDASPVALSLASPDVDHPLLFVNRHFIDLTGYAAEEIIGRNCRLLQQGFKDQQAHAKFRTFFDNENAATIRAPMVNFRKDGTAFINLLFIARLRGIAGGTRYFLASQFDVTRVHADRLHTYDQELASGLTTLEPIATDCGIAVDHAILAVGDAVSLIAQAHLALDK